MRMDLLWPIILFLCFRGSQVQNAYFIEPREKLLVICEDPEASIFTLPRALQLRENPEKLGDKTSYFFMS